MTRTAFHVVTLLLGLLVAGTLLAEDRLQRDFLTPPDDSKPWCYWWWLNGAASKEGITRDFEEMRKQGIAGALLFDAGIAGSEAPRGPRFMSAQWRELYRHALHEANRHGIVLSVNLCSGWNAGGPWVTHEHAAKKLVSAQTLVQGARRVHVALPKPPLVQGFYREIAVLATPATDGGYTLRASSQYRDYGPALADDGDDQSRWISHGDRPGMGPTPKKPEFLQFDCVEPWTAAGVYLKPYSECGPKDVEVQCSDDDHVFRPIKRVTLKPHDTVTIAFDKVRAKHFRVVFLSAHPHHDGASWNVQVAEIALVTRTERDTPVRSLRGTWNRGQMIDLTKFVDDQGRLTWDAPDGRWNVLRVGYTLHGREIKEVGSGPAGLEIDPMSAEAMDAHFAETGSKLIADAGPLVGKTLQYFHIDSWELGQPTWTPNLREEFQKRHGYDPFLYLPALSQQTVDDLPTTQRFLADYRRTIAELIAANYYGRFRELTLRGGLRGTHPESGGPGICCWIDALACEGINDIPMGEFWKRNAEPEGPNCWSPQTNPTVKQAASAAHIYGKPSCQAEAFTSFACDWIDDPWTMKDIGDEAFCHGLTRNVLCFWVHQPRLDAKPGFQWAHVGTHFDCNLTWWPMSGAWLTYLARCQHMLRQGGFVADFAYLQSEAIPSFMTPRPSQQPVLPAGFDYDALNSQVLLGRASANHGRLTLPDGMSYGYLVLPHQPDAVLSPAVLGKINELAEGGVPVIGPSTLAGQVTRMRQGALDAVVRADGLAPDIEFREPSARTRFDWIHRRNGPTEIYFVSNQSAAPATARVTFRVAGKQPELWDAVTGAIRSLPDWREEKGRTIVPLQFAPRQSWFVVFRNPASPPREVALVRNFPEAKTVLEVAGPWTVSFDPKWKGPERAVFEKLEDWTTRSEEGIRHYSGSATYRNRFAWSRALSPGQQVLLDLGTVKNVARVRLNGRDLGVVWTAPWQAEVTAAVKPGVNELEVDVANLWSNRLIGDAPLPKDKRLTVTNVRTYDTMTSGTYGCKRCEERKKTGKPAALLPSGLLGPVRVMTAE